MGNDVRDDDVAGENVGLSELEKLGLGHEGGNGNGNGLLFHMTQPISRSTIKAIACSKPTISEH